MSKPDQPITELCERVWKLLYRLGERETDSYLNATMYFKLEKYRLFSKNRFLWVSIIEDSFSKRTIFTVDEDGEVGSLDIIECAIALERFRQYTVLDDLAEV